MSASRLEWRTLFSHQKNYVQFNTREDTPKRGEEKN